MPSTNNDSRQNPSEGFIQALRERFPTDREVDTVLTRKMRNRALRQEGYSPVSLPELMDGVSKLLADRVKGEFSISSPRWLAGGASMIQMAFELSWRGESGEEPEHSTPLVLRMSPMEPVVETSFLREAEIVNFVSKADIMPVPKCYWIDEEGDYLPYPAIIYGFVSGVAKPSKIPSTQVTGVGLNFGPELREKLAPQVIGDIAKLHAFDASKLELPGFDPVQVGSNDSVIREINWWHRVWEEDRGEDEPLIQIAANWLRRNAPPLDHVSIVHNDLRSGNFLFDEENASITAWLDWELVSLGDRHQDLGWLTGPQFGHFAEDGKTFLISGLMPREALFEAYEAATGLSVDPQRMQYYDVMNAWKAAIIVMATGYRVANGSKTHQDVVVTWLSAIGYLLLSSLKQLLTEAKA